jgi:hypothetical protein
MNKKIMILGAGAALLIGSAALAQATSDPSKSSNYQAPSATNSATNSAATAPDNSVNNPSTANSANSAGTNSSATAGERG